MHAPHDRPIYDCYTPLIFGDDFDRGTETCRWVAAVGRVETGRYVWLLHDLTDCREAAARAGGSVGAGNWEELHVLEG